MEDHFVHCDIVKPSFSTPLKVEDNEIIDLFEIFKEVQPTLDLQIDLIVQSNFYSKVKLKRLQ